MSGWSFSLRTLFLGVVILSMGAGRLEAVPQLLSYQGRIDVNGVNYNGTGLFKFALVNAAGDVTYWSNDGTSAGGGEPTATVSLNVVKGLYTVLLGDATLANMTAIPSSVFANDAVFLRVWFDDGSNGSQMISPDRRIAAVGFAMMAESVADGAITAAKIAPGAVTGGSIAAGAVGSSQLAEDAVTSDKIAPASGDFDMNLFPIINLAPPVGDRGAARKIDLKPPELTDNLVHAWSLDQAAGVRRDLVGGYDSDWNLVKVDAVNDPGVLSPTYKSGTTGMVTNASQSFGLKSVGTSLLGPGSSTSISLRFQQGPTGGDDVYLFAQFQWVVLRIRDTDGALVLQVGGNVTTEMADTSADYRDSLPHHIIFGFDGQFGNDSLDQKAFMDVDGKARLWHSQVEHRDNTHGQVYLGNLFGLPGTFASGGWIDDVIVWSRTLTPAESRKIYDLEIGIEAIIGGSLQNLRYDETMALPGGGDIAVFQSGEGNLVGSGGIKGVLANMDTVGAGEIDDNAVVSSKIAAGAVNSSQLGENAVTSGKIAVGAVTSSRLGDSAVTSTKIVAGAVTSSQLDDNAVTSVKIATGAVTSSQLGDSAVTSSKIMAGAVTSTQLGDLAVTSAKIAAGAVTSTQLDDEAVTGAKIAAGAVTSSQLGDGAVTSMKIAMGAVTSTQLDDNAVTGAKIAAGAVSSSQLDDGAVTSAKLGAAAAAQNLAAAGAVLLSDVSNSPDLAAAGFVNIGSMNSSGTWSELSPSGAPAPRELHSVVWTGAEMILWGGNDGNPTYPASGARYDPSSDGWVSTQTVGAPAGRLGHSAVWTGSTMVVWGGFGDTGYMDSGSLYDPGADSWQGISGTDAPIARAFHSAVWTGTEVIIWGGRRSFSPSPSSTTNTGARYNPATDTWTPMSTTGAPVSRSSHVAVWTGTEMIVWGGEYSSDSSVGGRYDPVTDTWTTFTISPGREGASAVWTGTEMVVWGGNAGVGPLADGFRFDPLTEAVNPMAISGAPSARAGHTAVWSGDEMIVWGGASAAGDRSGGRYDPVMDIWTSAAVANAPENRSSHTAVWAGNQMIVWGGYSLTDAAIIGTGSRMFPGKMTYIYRKP